MPHILYLPYGSSTTGDTVVIQKGTGLPNNTPTADDPYLYRDLATDKLYAWSLLQWHEVGESPSIGGTFRQVSTNTSAGGDFTVTLSQAPLQNSLLLAVSTGNEAASASINGITLTGTSGWARRKKQSYSSNNQTQVDVWSTVVGAGAGTTVSFDIAGSGFNYGGAVMEFTGLSTVDATNGQTQNGSGFLSYAQPGGRCFVFAATRGSTLSLDGAWTEHSNVSITGMGRLGIWSQDVSASSNTSVTDTLTSNSGEFVQAQLHIA